MLTPPPLRTGVAAETRRGDAPMPVITEPLPAMPEPLAWPEMGVDVVGIFLNAEPARTFRSDDIGSDGLDGLADGMVRSIDGCREPLNRLAARAYRSTDESRLGGRL